VSKKIDKWHTLSQVNKDELLIFERDEEYIEADRSPTHFGSSSEEEEDNE
jgi:hypothetical protein